MHIKFLLPAILLVLCANLLSAQNPLLVADANTQQQELSIETHSGLIEYNNRIYFTATDNAGPYLWSTDGTVSGTSRNLKPAFNHSGYGHFTMRSITSGGYLYYYAGAADTGSNQLWKTDGTPAGTQLLGSLNPENFIDLSGIIYFSGMDEAHGNELWRSDGTPGGTYLVKDIVEGEADSDPLHGKAILGDKLIFTANEEELYVTDGTAAGTFALQQNVEQEGSLFANCLINFQGAAYFIMRNDLLGEGLWKTDGTASGTVLVKDLETATGFFGDASNLVVAGDQLFFIFESKDFGYELWASDGTFDGTKMVKDIRPGTSSGLYQSTTDLYPINDKVFFGGDDGIHGEEPWCSDGTDAGTYMITDLAAGISGSDPFSFVPLADKVLFSATATGTDDDLFITDGSGAGTVFIAEAPLSYTLKSVAAFAGKIFYVHGAVYPYAELWFTDGTVSGTQQVNITLEQNQSSRPANMIRIAPSKYVFSNWYGDSGSELWVTDGSPAGSEKFFTSPDIGEIEFADEPLNGNAFFLDYDNNGPALWKTDGTEPGTIKVKEVNPDFEAGTVVLNDVLYFAAIDVNTSYSTLWRTDGTEAGTYQVLLINNSGHDLVNNLVLYNNQLFFSAKKNAFGPELWKSDGTAAGTIMVKDIEPGQGGSFPDQLTVANGKLYFTAETIAEGTEPWISDGTAAGTMLLKDVNPGVKDSGAENYTAAGGFVYFDAYSDISGLEIWKTDGINTTEVSDMISGDPNYLSSLNAFNDQLYFVVDKNILAATDASGAVTESIYTVEGEIKQLKVVNDELYFTVVNTLNYYSVGHLWHTDGTTSGTEELDFFSPVLNELSGDAKMLLVDSNFLFLGLNGENTGIELWKYDAASPLYTEIIQTEHASFLVYPNPSSTGIFEFRLPQIKGNATFTLSDITGRIIYEEQIEKGSNAVNISSFAKGWYLLEITSDAERFISKIIYE